MMYKLIIADDEEMIRRGFALGFNWEQMGYTLCGQAKNGQDALALIKEHKAHVLLTDIQMPQMNGLDLIEKALEIQPSLRTVILTGYGQFEYARRALLLKAFDYVLKIDIDVALEPVMKRLKNQLDDLPMLADEDEWNINGAINYIHEHYHEKISLAEVADKFCMSQAHFCRHFKKVTGKGFNETLRNYRLENAYRLLMFSDMRVGDVATRVGYKDSRYFSDLFLKKYGALPSAIKKKQTAGEAKDG